MHIMHTPMYNLKAIGIGTSYYVEDDGFTKRQLGGTKRSSVSTASLEKRLMLGPRMEAQYLR